jgi:2-dehydropantoate 2-reductase
MTKFAIAIAGAGALGSTFGGLLGRDGHDVTLVDVDADHVKAVAANGLVLRHADGSEWVVPIAATTDPELDLGPVDAVIVLCKGWANRTVAESIRHAVGPATWVATLQNGLGNAETLGAVLGPERVLPGTTTAGAFKPEPGVVDVSPITSSGSSITQLGPPLGTRAVPEGVDDLATALTEAGLPCEVLLDAGVVIWTKLAMAATAGPLTAALGTTVEGMLSTATGRALLTRMFDEVVAVAAAEGVDLDRAAVWGHAMATYEAVGPHLTSMAADVAAGRRTEIDSFCVELCRRGVEHGVPTPTHDTIGRLIVAREEERGLR